MVPGTRRASTPRGLANPRAHAGLPARGRVGAADTWRPGRLPAPRAAHGLLRPGRSSSARCALSSPIRWKLGDLFGLDRPAGRPWRAGADPARPPAGGPERRPRSARADELPFRSLYLTDDEWALEIANETVHGVHPPRLGRGRGRWPPRSDGRPGEAQRLARTRLHGGDNAVQAPRGLSGDAAGRRASLAGRRGAPGRAPGRHRGTTS